MNRISRGIWSHESLQDQRRHSVEEIRASKALPVNTFSELVNYIADISYHNPQFSLFYRAQAEDHQTKDGNTSLYPSIYRDIPSESRGRLLERRFNLLQIAEKELLREFEKQRFLGRSKLTKFREVRWALLQHYRVCKTPLLDLTYSLRVACSFAMDCAGISSYIFVLGLPDTHGSISYSVEEELLVVKLLSICPPRAIRPYFQEGFLVGSFPSPQETRSTRLDVSGRLIAKFRLNHETFQDKNFVPIPHETLYPQNDAMEEVFSRVKQRTISQTQSALVED
jgi:hypothetical protein